MKAHSSPAFNSASLGHSAPVVLLRPEILSPKHGADTIMHCSASLVKKFSWKPRLFDGSAQEEPSVPHISPPQTAEAAWSSLLTDNTDV